MAEETSKRKADHIKICLTHGAQAKKAKTGFEDVHLVHCALPEVNKEKIDLSANFLGHNFKAPLIVSAMTGGTPEAEKINSNIAQAVEKLGLGMGLGSQRLAILDPKLAKTFAIARKKAPNAFLIANIGGVQLVDGYGIKEVKQTIEMIEADALAVHLNALQEVVQPEGQTNFEGILQRISEIVDELDVPVIAKETGAGIAAKEAKALESAGVKALDVGGLGGTSFAAVEYFRTEDKDVNRRLGEVFWDWGIPTAVSLVETAQSVHLPTVASGGIRSGCDAAKALALGATLASLAQPVLPAANTSATETAGVLSRLIEELRSVMFLVGADKVEKLAGIPTVITGNTAQWLKARGFNVDKYARKGIR